MVYCQKCGAGNVDEARFCNMCGTKIASPGEPGGPLATAPDVLTSTLHGHAEGRREELAGTRVDARADDRVDPDSGEPTAAKEAVSLAAIPDATATPAPEPARVPPAVEVAAHVQPAEAPPPFKSEPVNVWDEGDDDPSLPPSRGSLDVSTISLSAIGVRSRAKAWAMLLGTAALLVGLGALGAWLAMRPVPERPAIAGTHETGGVTTAGIEEEDAEEEIVLGDPLPPGEELPEVVGGTPQPRHPAMPGASRSSGRSTSGEPVGSSPSGAASGESTSGARASGAPGTAGADRSGAGGASSEAGSSETELNGSEAAGSAVNDSSGAGESGSGRDWEEMEASQPLDLEMDLYSGRVRSVIRNYYMGRAASCFDHASRNHRDVRGTVLIGFEIRADGTVDRARVDRNTTGIDSLGACLARQVGSWRLPPPPDDSAPLAMQMPFSR